MHSSEPVRPSRRSVVRGGAALAWSVPVVLLATSAPAHAASGDTTLQVVLSQPVRGLDATKTPPTQTALMVSSTITNTGTFPTRALSVVLRVTASTPIELSQSTASAVAGFATPVRSGSGQQVFFTYLANSQLDALSSIVFNPTVQLQSETDGALQVAASPGNGTTDEASLPYQ
ncbi:MAG: hypothetical protein WB471_13830 [Nocardioides sp.]